MRVKRGVTARAKHKKILKAAKGMQHAYRDRRNRKRDLRALWITRINIAARENGTTYGKLIAGLKAKNIELDRKVLAELAVSEPKAFAKIVESVK